jgi:tricorn protease
MLASFRSAPRLLALLCATATLPALAESPTKLLRFPDVHGQLVTFVYAGDLYLANASGGTAQRLTSHRARSCTRSSRPTAARSRSRPSTAVRARCM